MLCDPLLAKLQWFTDFEQRDRRLIEELCSDVREYRAGDDLIAESEQPHQVFVLLDGWAYRYKLLSDGSRQITAYMLPGDVCDIYVFILKQMDHSVGLLSNAKVALFDKDRLLRTMHESPRVAEALWWSTLVDESVLRQWIVNVGQRQAYERVAHLFCELGLRLKMVGLSDGREFYMPVTQAQLGDTIGLTPVHVNRTLQRMREEKLIELDSKLLKICDIDRLTQIASFDPNYLHLERRRR